MNRLLLPFLLCLSNLLATGQICKTGQSFISQNTKLYKSAGSNTDILYAGLHLNLNPALLQMSGSVEFKVKSLQNNLKQLTFNLDDTMKVDSVKSNNVKLSFNHNIHVITVNLSETSQNGDIIRVTVYYHGDPTKARNRSYSVEKHGRDTAIAPIIWTLSQPYGAEDWWPCKNTLNDKIDTLDVFVTCPLGNRAASNGLLVKTDTLLAENKVTFHWHHQYPVATYLVAVAVTNYSEFTDTVFFKDGRKLPVLNYVYPEQLATLTANAAEIIPQMILFDSLFGTYPFINEKYGHAQFSRGGGMEHQTMSFMSSLDYDLMAHELAHQWFGDKITCNSWQDIWLNEGFATYLTALCYNFLKPDKWIEYLGKIKQDVLKKNEGSVYVVDTLSVARIFDGRLTYDKGAMVLHNLRFFMGDSIFFKTLKAYINQPQTAYGFVNSEHLQTVAEQISGKNLSDFFAQWLYGEGFPIFSIDWKQNGNTQSIKITQQTSTPVTKRFDIGIPLLFKSENKTYYRVINVPDQTDFNYFDFGEPITEVLFDPYNQILAKGNVINSGNFSKSVVVYPNPAADFVQFSSAIMPISSIEIYDVTGKKMNETAFTSNQKEVNYSLQNLSSGFYQYRVYFSKGSASGKLIISK